jgi:hypothetical protein
MGDWEAERLESLETKGLERRIRILEFYRFVTEVLDAF